MATQQSTPEEDVLTRLPQERKGKLDQEWNRLRKDNLAVDRLAVTQFFDKRNLLLEWGFVSGKKQKAEFEKDLDEIEQLLRNPLAHAGDFALNEQTALEIVSIVRSARYWIDRLEKAVKESSIADGTS